MAENEKLHQFLAYQKACELFDLAVADPAPLAHNPLCARLVSQQVASAGSVASNIEEGYGRESRKDYAPFLVISRGSAAETRGRYTHRLKRWLSPEVIAARVRLCEEIIAILSKSIRTLRSNG